MFSQKVTKTLQVYLLPILNFLDWNEDNCKVRTFHSQSYVNLIASQNFHADPPHWLDREDKEAFLVFMRNVLDICTEKFPSSRASNKASKIAQENLADFRDSCLFLE